LYHKIIIILCNIEIPIKLSTYTGPITLKSAEYLDMYKLSFPMNSLYMTDMYSMK